MDRSIAIHLVYIAAFLLTLLLGALVVPWIIGMPLGTEVLTPLAMIATGLIGVLAAAAAYEFGDSKGSRQKTETAAAAAESTAAALTTATDTIASIATGATPTKPEEKKDA